jgi:hypothetical protein
MCLHVLLWCIYKNERVYVDILGKSEVPLIIDRMKTTHYPLDTNTCSGVSPNNNILICACVFETCQIEFVVIDNQFYASHRGDGELLMEKANAGDWKMI